MRADYYKMFMVAAALAFGALTSCNETKNSDGETDSTSVDSTAYKNGDETEDKVKYTTFDNVNDGIKAQLGGMLDEYVNLKDALVATDAKKAQSEAKEMLTKYNGIDKSLLDTAQTQFYAGYDSKIKEDVEAIAGTDDVEQQRTHFKTLSENLFYVAKAFNPSTETLYWQYCPMAFDNNGAYWISQFEEIKNPYWGEKMLTCGSNKDKVGS